MRSLRLLLLVAVLALTAQAVTINYTVTGTTDLGFTLQLTFSLDQNPSVLASGADWFGVVPLADPPITLSMNGVSYGATVLDVGFYGGLMPMLVVEIVAPETGGCTADNWCMLGMSGPQLYTGPEAAPTLLTGAFPATPFPSAPGGEVGYLTLHSGGWGAAFYSGLVQAQEDSVPEPATAGLLLLAAGATAFGLRKRRAVPSRDR